MNQPFPPAGAAALLIAGLAGLPALAACPTAADAKTGIGVTFDDGNQSRILLRDNGDIEETFFATYPGEPDFVTLSQHGVWLYSTMERMDGKVDEATRANIEFTTGAEKIAPPTPGMTWTGESVWDKGTVLEYRESYVITGGELTTMTTGECQFEVFPVRIEVTSENENYTDFLLVFPELGVTVLTATQSAGEFWNPKITAITAMPE